MLFVGTCFLTTTCLLLSYTCSDFGQKKLFFLLSVVDGVPGARAPASLEGDTAAPQCATGISSAEDITGAKEVSASPLPLGE